MTDGLFDFFADESVGVLSATWWFNGAGGDAAPAPPPPPPPPPDLWHTAGTVKPAAPQPSNCKFAPLLAWNAVIVAA